MTTFPDMTTAISVWQESLAGVNAWQTPQSAREYIAHTVGIAEAAAEIASHCGLDVTKAYVLGLLHDYGKMQNENQTGYAHFMFGYDRMNVDGWTDAARICLTHSFPDPDFHLEDYASYPSEDVKKAKQLISQLQYDDYDRLIQLCDILFEGTTKTSYRRRIEFIRQRYNLSPSQTAVLERKNAENKAYFDAKCSCDIYDLLGIKE